MIQAVTRSNDESVEDPSSTEEQLVQEQSESEDLTYLLSQEEANELVIEHQGWAESIARAVARAWNLDWKLDGLDGAALEALLFCARRFNPRRGVPFRGYSRRRIHEASADAARRSRGWRRGFVGGDSNARELSSELFHIFPELREGRLPAVEVSSAVYKGDRRSAIRQILVGAALLSAHNRESGLDQEEAIDFKATVAIMAGLDSVHQMLLYAVYWEGKSLRQLAAEWEIEGLTVIREHRVILDYLGKRMSGVKGRLLLPKVRPGLREIAAKFLKPGSSGPFSDVMNAQQQEKAERERANRG
jgi:DNA-directed RNA polymerase specialized sigma subunit